MPMTYTLAFSIYKPGIKDDDGLLKIADVELGIVSGPLAGLAIEGIRIKEHKGQGLQMVYPPNVECFLKEGRSDVDRTILRAFVDAFTEGTRMQNAKPRMDDFTGIPEPTGGVN